MLAPDGRVLLDRQQLTRKAHELDCLLEKISGVRDELRRIAACPSASHEQCPSFQQRLKDVARKDVLHGTFGR